MKEDEPQLPPLIDEPTPFDTLQVWERHLKVVEGLPANTVGRDLMISHAREMITQKKTADDSRAAPSTSGSVRP